MNDLMLDLRHAVRMLARKKGISALAVVSLALGIGVNSAIFSIVNAVLLRDLPFAEPDRLVEVYGGERDGFAYATASFPDYRDLREQNDVFASLAAYNVAVATYDDGVRTTVLFGEEVTANYFDTLGVRPALGRGFLPAEDVPGAGQVVVLGHGFWQRRFAADPGVLGRSIELNGLPFTVVGVAPEALQGSFPALIADYWLPLGMHDAMSEIGKLERRTSRWLWIRGRLRPEVPVARAQAQMDTLMARLAAAYPETNEGRTITLVPTRGVALNPGIDGPLFGVAGLLMVVVGLVLLIACSNIANLLLARASARRREIAVRLALGASRRRLIRLLLAESLVLAGLGGVAGLLLAQWTARLIVGFQPPLPLTLSIDLGIDSTVLLFTLALALLTGVLCGLAPALQSSRPDLVPALKNGADTFERRYRRFGLRNGLVVAQVAISTVLLIGAGLFLRSLSRAQSIDPGFSLRSGVAAQLAIGLGGRYDETSGQVFYRRLIDEARALPGVRSAALAESLPLGWRVYAENFELEDHPAADDDDLVAIDTMAVGDGYFATVGMALAAGRDFGAGDLAAAPGVAIVNETLARRYWPQESPLGKRLRMGRDQPWLEVVGVAQDGKYRTLGEVSRPYVYTHLAQDYGSMMTLVLAADIAEPQLAAATRGLIERLDPELPIFSLSTISDHLRIMLFPARMGALLLAVFGVLGLVLASVGLYGVVAYTVACRTREVGIRMAIGAGRGDVLRLVVGEGMVLVGVGLALGLALALGFAQLLGGLLYGIRASDPVTFAGVALVLAAVALLANLVPARRATRVDPVVALRCD